MKSRGRLVISAFITQQRNLENRQLKVSQVCKPKLALIIIRVNVLLSLGVFGTNLYLTSVIFFKFNKNKFSMSFYEISRAHWSPNGNFRYLTMSQSVYGTNSNNLNKSTNYQLNDSFLEH